MELVVWDGNFVKFLKLIFTSLFCKHTSQSTLSNWVFTIKNLLLLGLSVKTGKICFVLVLVIFGYALQIQIDLCCTVAVKHDKL